MPTYYCTRFWNYKGSIKGIVKLEGSILKPSDPGSDKLYVLEDPFKDGFLKNDKNRDVLYLTLNEDVFETLEEAKKELLNKANTLYTLRSKQLMEAINLLQEATTKDIPIIDSYDL